MRDCVGILVESARIPTKIWHSLWQSARMTGSAIDFHRPGVTDRGRDDDSACEKATESLGVEPTCGGLP